MLGPVLTFKEGEIVKQLYTCIKQEAISVVNLKAKMMNIIIEINLDAFKVRNLFWIYTMLRHAH